MACQRQRLSHLRLRDSSTTTTMTTDNSDSSTSFESSVSSATSQNNSSSATYAVLGRIASWILERERQQCSLNVNVPYNSQSRYFRPVEVASSIERLIRRCEASLSAVESVLVRKDGSDDSNLGRRRPSNDKRGGACTGLWLLLSATNLEAECLMVLLHLAVALDIPMAWASLIVAALEHERSDDDNDDDIPNIDELHYVNENPQLLYPWLIQEASINGSLHTLKLLLENAPALVDRNGDSTPDSSRESSRQMNAPPFRPCRMARSDAMQFLERLASTMKLLGEASVENPWGKDGYGDSDLLQSPSSYQASHTSLSSSFGQSALHRTAAIEEWDESTERIRSRPDDPAVEPICAQAMLRSSMTRSKSARERPGAQGGRLNARVAHLLLALPCGSSPLHWASYKGYVECAALLLEHGADPNAVAIPTGWTPLHDAAYSNSTQVMELLLDAGANVNATAASGATPLCFACQEDAADAARLLLKHQAAFVIPPAVVHSAASTTRNGSAHLLPNSGLTVVPPPPLAVASTSSLYPPRPPPPLAGYTPLHYCARFNSARAARVLLSHCESADVSYPEQPTSCLRADTLVQGLLDAPDFYGRRSLDIACIRASVDVLYELLHHGATVGTRSRNSRSSYDTSSFPAAAFPTPATLRTVSDLRSMIPKEPVVAPKPWNCLTQESIDGCHALLDRIDGGWTPDCHDLYTPEDRVAVDAIQSDVSDDLERTRGVYRDVWPVVLSYCGRGWFRSSSTADGSRA